MNRLVEVCSETNGVFSVGTKFVLSISFSSGQLVGRQFVKRAGLLARAMPFLVVVVFFTHLTIGVGTFGHFGKSGSVGQRAVGGWSTSVSIRQQVYAMWQKA